MGKQDQLCNEAEYIPVLQGPSHIWVLAWIRHFPLCPSLRHSSSATLLEPAHHLTINHQPSTTNHTIQTDKSKQFTQDPISIKTTNKSPLLQTESTSHIESINNNNNMSANTVHVKNISSSTSEKEVRDFFSFW
jgi:hypothetical protein